ncbi:MAG: UTP--glucose-1-phosphate uridylyltransferase [Spirochaetes bacterium]|nr:UTP--glucose-1-phosphate uridylyltransferase [Spirochaetota bacterium]
MNTFGRNIKEANLIKKMIKHGQEHVLYFWDELNNSKKNNLINDLFSINFKKTKKYFNDFLKHKSNHHRIIQPTEYLSILDRKKNNDIKSIGEESLKSNKIAFLTVAGGQGSRLGYNKPKGCFPITPVKNNSLFQIFAEKIKFYSHYYKNNFYWYIMTSEFNYSSTIIFFEKNKYFGLNKKNVIFFKQAMLPTLTLDGNLILCKKDKLFLNPDGHGGILKALLKIGLLYEMKNNGIKHLSYFQIDNPLVKIADPYFIGYHIKEKSMVSSKVIPKLYPEEKLGSICKINEVNSVIEYSDLPKEEMYKKNSKGELEYLMGSIAIHIFDIEFLLNFTKKIPIHFAKKTVKGYSISDNKDAILKNIDGLKFETFVFDSIPISTKSIFFETVRDNEFFPLKNKDGADSIATCKKGQSKLFASWLRTAGLWNEEYKDQQVEISPIYAPDKEFFLEKVKKDSDNIIKAIFDKNGKIRNEIYIK